MEDYKLYSYGQTFPDDQFIEILDKMKEADTIVIGSPVYWHNMSGAIRNLLDRFYGPVSQGELKGRSLYFLFQGAEIRRIYHEPFCEALRYDIYGNGQQHRRGRKALERQIE